MLYVPVTSFVSQNITFEFDEIEEIAMNPPEVDNSGIILFAVLVSVICGPIVIFSGGMIIMIIVGGCVSMMSIKPADEKTDDAEKNETGDVNIDLSASGNIDDQISSSETTSSD
uniref:Uncharacterized protein n=1 Tax=viral metagenome TaxID=1070528 RepID=A0A6C0C6G6_9ZZZZ